MSGVESSQTTFVLSLLIEYRERRILAKSPVWESTIGYQEACIIWFLATFRSRALEIRGSTLLKLSLESRFFITRVNIFRLGEKLPEQHFGMYGLRIDVFAAYCRGNLNNRFLNQPNTDGNSTNLHIVLVHKLGRFTFNHIWSPGVLAVLAVDDGAEPVEPLGRCLQLRLQPSRGVAHPVYCVGLRGLIGVFGDLTQLASPLSLT